MNDSTLTRFFAAVRDGDVAVARHLAQTDSTLVKRLNKDYFNGTALNMATGRNDRAMVEVLIEVGADLDQTSDWWAGPWSAVQSALNYGHDELAAFLIELGATLDVHGAAGLSRLEELTRMLDEDASLVSARGGDGCQPLHFAGSIDAAQLLLDRGADLDARDVDHYSTPAQYLAKNRSEVSRFLLDQGSTPDIFVAVISNHADLVKRLVQNDRSVLDWRIDQAHFPPSPEHDVHNIMTFAVGGNSTPLHAAASAARLDMIDLLVELGMDVNQKGGYDECSALHTAAWDNRPDVIERLLAHGANMDQRSGNNHNNSAAGWAIVAGSHEALERLLDHGAEVLEFFIEDAQRALQGEFRQHGNRNVEAQERIVTLLRNQAG